MTQDQGIARGESGRAHDFTETTFDAAHKGEYAEQVHGHTWHVRVFWPADPPRDARFMHAQLRQYIEAAFEHRLLDDICTPTNYGVAKALARLMGEQIKIIEVWRGGMMPCGARIEL